MKTASNNFGNVWLPTLFLLTLSAPSIAHEGLTPVQSAVAARISGDMSNACIAAARIMPNQEGMLEVERGFACASAEIELPDQHSRFEIGSISKTMLGGLVAVLAEEKKIDVQQPVMDLLPAGVAFSDPRAESMTIAHLLTHSSGLPRLPANLTPREILDPYADYTESQLWEAVQLTELTAPPGQVFGYSNFAYMLLSKLISEYAEKSFTSVLTETIFTPLGMSSASLNGPTLTPHNAEGGAVLNWHMAEDMGGVGAVRASLIDMENYLKAHLGEAPEPLRSALQQSQRVLDSPNGRDMGWGWMYAPTGGVNYLAHGGGTGGFTAMIAFDPNTRTGAVVLANGALYQTGDIQLLALHLLNPEVPVGAPYRLPVKPEALDLTDYEGVYPLLPGFALRVFVQDGDLRIQGTGQPSAAVLYAEQDTFENRQFGARFVFERDAAGQVIAVVLYQAGQQLRGEREFPHQD